MSAVSAQPHPHEHPDVVWTKKTTPGGKAYEIGFQNASTEASTALSAMAIDSGPIMRAHGTQQPFNVTLDWPVGDNTWKDTTSTVYDIAGLQRYKLYEYDGFWKYTLYITNNVNYNY